MQKKLGLWYSRFEPKPAKGFGAAIMGEQEFSKGPGKTHTLWTAERMCRCSGELQRDNAEQHPKLSSHRRALPSFPHARLPTANSQRHSPLGLLCCLYSLIHDSKQKHHGRRRSESPSVHGHPVSLRSPPITQITARQPKALPPRSHRQGRLCSIKVGSRVQGLSRIHRWLYELASESCAP